jgi:6-phosphofructokinase 2
MIKIFTLTMNPAIDKSAQVNQIEPDKKLRCQEPVFTPGGGGINVARAIHNLGGEAKAIYPAGGPTGDMLEQLLEKENIHQYRVKTKNWTRENVSIIEETTNNQYRFEMPGAPLNEHETAQSLETFLKESQAADFLVASGSLPEGVPDDFYAKLAKKTQGTHPKLIIDTSGQSLKKLKGSGVFLLKPNLREFREFTGLKLLSEEDQKQAGRELVNNGTCEVLVLSLGPDGVLLVTHDFQIRFRSPKVAVKSRIGAGDSTVAGIVLGLTQDMDLKEAVMFGISCGASTVMSPGNELCQKSEVERIFNQMKEGRISNKN